MNRHEFFNQSGFSKFLNSMAGRIFRLVAGAGFPPSWLCLSGSSARRAIYDMECLPIKRRSI